MAIAELLHRLLSKSLQLGDRLPIDVVGRLEVEVTNPGGIVDHNLDVPNPPNGRYIRFASGLQICWFVGQRQTGSFGQNIWTYPSSFSEPPLFIPVAAVPNAYVDRNATNWYQIDVDHRLTFVDNNPNNVAAYRLSRGSSFLSQETHWAWLIAVGRRV